MPSSHLILCHPLVLLPPIPPTIRVFSNELALLMRWPKYWSFSFSIIPSKEIPGLISFRMTGWISLQSKGLSRVFSRGYVETPKARKDSTLCHLSVAQAEECTQNAAQLHIFPEFLYSWYCQVPWRRKWQPTPIAWRTPVDRGAL